MDTLKKFTKKQLIEKINELAKKFNTGIDKTKMKGNKASLIQEYQRILLITEAKAKNDKLVDSFQKLSEETLLKQGLPMEQITNILSKKDAKKSLRDANKKVKSISGLIRLIKAFESEYKPALKAYGIDIDKLSPKYIKGLWKSEFIIDGKICEQYRKKNPLYSETDDIEAQKQGIKYEIPTHVDDIREVENFTPNKLIKYCGQ